MTTTVFLVRHGAHDLLGRVLCGRMEGVPINADGERQATWLAERLSAEAIAAVESSPSLRARQTAAPIAARLGLSPQVSDPLDEIDFGAWTGKPFAALAGDPAWEAWNAARSLARAPGGESMLEAQGRIVAHIERRRREHPGAGIALVGHSDMIKAALAHALGLSLDHLQRFEVDPGSVSTLVVGDWGAKVLSLNERART